MIRKNGKYLGVLILAGMLCTGCSSQTIELGGKFGGPEYNLGFDENRNLTFAEEAEILRTLGITGLTDELVEETQKGCEAIPEEVFYSKTAMLLIDLGSGTYDFENDTWTPGDSNVYSFDMEVFNLETMYTDFLRGVAAIGDGELEFTNIKEDTSHVNWDLGIGKRSVTFDWNGESYTLTARMQMDWFDENVIKQLNEIIQKKGGEKQLYCASDGGQECIIFYQNAEWAKEFEKKTGLELGEF